MLKHQCGSVLILTVAAAATVLGDSFALGDSKQVKQEDMQMNTTRIMVDHVRLTTNKTFDDVTRSFEQKLGRFDPVVYKALAEGSDAEGTKAQIEAMA